MMTFTRTCPPFAIPAFLVFAQAVWAAPMGTHEEALPEPAVYMTTGMKIGEVRDSSAIIWLRLTRQAEPAAGVAGEVRVRYWPADTPDQPRGTPWQAVDTQRDFTRQFDLADLRPQTRYRLVAEGRRPGGRDPDCTVQGAFRTPPSADTPARVAFTVVTGQEYTRRDDPGNGHRIYPVMQRLDPDFFVHTGDIVYYDKPGPLADTPDLARLKWSRMYALPYQREFHRQVASYFIKDDHDTLKDDCWPGQSYGDLTWDQGLAIFREQVPMGDRTYRTIRWGNDLQIWLVEGRDFRSPNPSPDGPAKTIWGTEQKQWFFDTVQASDAAWRILISPTPLVGPDRASKNDNHANRGFTHEGKELRSFIGRQQNMFVICGDRHWQYVSVDPTTGTREYSCGPTSDVHAGGFSEDKRSPMHQYLKVKGGFLSVVVDRTGGIPRIAFRHHGVDGSLYNEDVFRSEGAGSIKAPQPTAEGHPESSTR